ncbi:MAG TPA: RDD family protein [Rhodanobacteraceae bacterium]|nr:RDD family protein [Rhodanobacteraceae bacterium]
MPQSPVVDAAATPAPLWRRFACMLYDLLPLVGLWMVAAGLWVLAFHRSYDPQHPDMLLHGLLDAWLFLVTAAYFVVSWTRVGQTIGMRAWKLKLVRREGGLPGWRTAALRFVLASLSLALLGCGFWVAWFDPERRTWHDRVCGTRMLRLPPRR